LIVDELGFVPFERTGGELLFNILAERHGQRSTVMTSNLAFGEWVQVFGNEKLTTALLDRLGHRSHILTTKGSSYRTGVIALFPTMCSVRQWESTSHNMSLASGQHKWGWQEGTYLVK
jgi:hypothetical protein